MGPCELLGTILAVLVVEDGSTAVNKVDDFYISILILGGKNW
jgi:hypothetical protein